MKKQTAIFSCVVIFVLILSPILGLAGGYLGVRLAQNNGNLGNVIRNSTSQDVQIVNEESAITELASNSVNSVVSIIISKDVPLYENYYSTPDDSQLEDFGFRIPKRRQVGTEEKEVGAGSGFIVSSDGMVITNRHVIETEDASYTAIFSDGTKKQAKVLAIDTLLDIAFLDIEGEDYKPLPLGGSKELKVGQTVVAIGNALGEFSNSVSSGIISGLSRNIQAGDASGQNIQTLNDVIQTDASINFGNSGGPLLDIKGNVIGVNVAVAGNAENIGFAIPIDLVIDLMDRLVTEGNIERPILGVRYTPITRDLKDKNNLKVDYGALVSKGTEDELAVLADSPADKAGIVENDIILEINNEKVTLEKPLQNLIQKYRINDTIDIKILRKGEEKILKVKLEKVIVEE